MRVALLLLATRAASAWSPTFRTGTSPCEIPSSNTEQQSHDSFVASTWDGMLPQTLGSDDVCASSGTAFLHGSPLESASSHFLELPEPSTGKSRRQHEALLDRTDHRRSSSSNRIDQPLTMQQQSFILSHTDAGTLQIEFLATGWNAEAAITGGFTIAWYAALAPITTTLAMVPILLPFYVVGGALAKSVLVDPFTSTALSIGKYGWLLSQSRYRRNALEVASGATPDLQRAIVVERRSHIATSKHRREVEYGYGDTRIQYRYELQLVYTSYGNKAKAVTIGKSFDNIDEPKQLADIINKQIENVRSGREVDGADKSNAESIHFPS